MNYIEFAENERLSTIVLGMMRISQMSEDEVEALVEAALSIGINTFDLADIYGDGQCEVLLGKRFSSVVRIFGTRCGSSPSAGFAKTALPILIFQGLYFGLRPWHPRASADRAPR